MKALRIALAVLGGLLLILIVAAIILVKTFDPNDFKDELTAWVQDRTGRTLAIEDDIELSLFPWFAVETGGVSLSDDPAFGTRDFIRVDELSARIRVWPLLRRRIEIGRVILDGLSLDLAVDAAGRGNWSTLVSAAAPEAPAAPPTAAPERPSIEALAVEGIELRNTRVLWRDASGDVRYLVRDLRLVTGRIEDTAPVDLTVSFSVLDVATQASAEIELTAVASAAPTPALGQGQLRIRVFDARNTERASAEVTLDSLFQDGTLLRSGPLSLTARLIDPPLGAERVDLAASLSELALDRDSETAEVSGLVVTGAGLEVRADIEGSGMLSAPALAGRLSARGDTIAALFDALGASPPAALATADAGGFTADAGFRFAPAESSAAIDAFTLSALGLTASGNAVRTAGGEITGRLEIPPFRPSPTLVAALASRLPEGSDPGTIASASLATDFAIGADGSRVTLDDLSLTLDALSVTGMVTTPSVTDRSRIQGEIEATGLDNALLAALLGNSLPPAIANAELGDFRLATRFEYVASTGRAVLDPLGLTAYGLSGSGQLIVETDGALALSGQARLDPFSPRALLGRFDQPVPQSADPTALTRAQLATSFETTGSNGRFRDIAITLDDSRITGEFSVDDFANPSYRFVLRADTVDADRYLPPKVTAPAVAVAAAGGTSPAAARDAEKRLGDIRLASESLSANRIAGTVSVGDLRIGGMRFEQLAGELGIGGGRGELRDVRTRLYGGQFAGGVAIDGTTEVPTLRLTGTATALAMQALLTDMLGEAYLSGSGDFELDLTGRGETIGRAVETAQGSMRVSFREGNLYGVNIGHGLCKAINSARQLPAPPPAPEQTPYRVISGSATVSEGLATSPDLFATTGYLELRGQGRMRLVDQTLDTSFVTRLTGPVDLPGCERLNSRVDGSVPFNFTLKGQLPEPEIGFDIGQLLEDLLRRELRNQTEDAIRESVGDALRRAFE